MLTLRYPWLWWGLGWLLIAAVIFGSLAPGGAVPDVSMGDKTMHALSYCALTLWFSGLVSRGRPLLSVALLLFLLGLLLDLAQRAVSTRSFEFLDVMANGGGILLGLVVAHLLLAGWCARIERLL